MISIDSSSLSDINIDTRKCNVLLTVSEKETFFIVLFTCVYSFP